MKPSKRPEEEKRRVESAIDGFAALIGEAVSVLDEPRVKALCLLKVRDGGASFSEIERAMGRRGGSVAYALRSMISRGVVEKIAFRSGAIVYRITWWGNTILEFCLGLAKLFQEVKQKPPYMSEREFELSKRWASVFREWLLRSELRESKLTVKREVHR